MEPIQSHTSTSTRQRGLAATFLRTWGIAVFVAMIGLTSLLVLDGWDLAASIRGGVVSGGLIGGLGGLLVAAAHVLIRVCREPNPQDAATSTRGFNPAEKAVLVLVTGVAFLIVLVPTVIAMVCAGAQVAVAPPLSPR